VAPLDVYSNDVKERSFPNCRQHRSWGFAHISTPPQHRFDCSESECPQHRRWARAGRESGLRDELHCTSPYHQKKEIIRLWARIRPASPLHVPSPFNITFRDTSKSRVPDHIRRRPHLHSVNLPRI